MYSFENLVEANKTIKTTNIKGKEYAEVPQRIKAFRMLCPNGAIVTEMLSNEKGVCVFKASVYNDEQILIGTGTAYEEEEGSFINKTSYIENCETSAVGRALGMCGFGIDTSVASAEEVGNAIANQERKSIVCEECGAVITDITKRDGSTWKATAIKEYSTMRFGKCLCYSCQKKTMKEEDKK